jgi:hypothetical protein
VTVLGMTNTRMKDFSTSWCCCTTPRWTILNCGAPIEATFSRRQTDMPSAQPIGLGDVFADDATKQSQWRALLNRNKLEPMDLREVVRTIRERAQHVGIPRT